MVSFKRAGPLDVKVLFITFVWLASIGNCLFEDQVGKFDWHQKYFGRLKFIVNDVNQPKRVVVGTHDNVIGALNSNNGAILYRHVLESSGKLKYLDTHDKHYFLAVSASQDQVKLRTFETSTGIRADEWALTAEASHVTAVDSVIYLVDADTKRPDVIVTTANLEDQSGKELKVSTRKITAALQASSVCEISTEFLVCTNRNHLVVVNVVDGTTSKYALENGFEGSKITTNGQGKLPFVVVSGNSGSKAFHIVANEKSGPEVVPFPKLSVSSGSISLSQAELDGEPVVFVSSLKSAAEIVVRILDRNLQELQQLSIHSNVPLAALELTKGFCASSRCGLVGFTADHLLFGTKIDAKGSSSSTMQVEWHRHEALASILASEMVDFPSELGPTWNPYLAQMDAVTAFVSRIKYEIESVILGESLYSSSMDRFGLRKLIVLVTSVGKVVGMDSATGTILYSFLLPDFDLLGGSAYLYIQRPAKFAPLKPQATVVYASAASKGSGDGTNPGATILYPFNPVDGKPLDQPQSYPQALQSQMLMQATEATKFLKPILLLDVNRVVHSYPANIPAVKKSFFFLAHKSPPLLQGYGIQSVTGSSKLQARLLWELNLGSGEVDAVHGKLPGERVHSQGRVLPDRSVSYKYMNPNLAVVVTTEVATGSINIFLIDVVSGSVVHSFWHKKCRGPVHVVHSEHWVVYSLFNEKSRRYEVNSVELYEGQSQSNSTAFSSFASPIIQPIVVKQSYIFPTGIQAMAHTRTEKGITNKDVLIALPNGGVLELPRMILQPRLSQQHYVQPIQDEDGVILSMPYIPELPTPAEMIINYNQSLKRVGGIWTWPTRLESTCLVLVHGLDLFYTRVTPSKTFDVLKDDFDHWFITVVLAGLVAGAYVTKRFSARKQLEQAWR